VTTNRDEFEKSVYSPNYEDRDLRRPGAGLDEEGHEEARSGVERRVGQQHGEAGVGPELTVRRHRRHQRHRSQRSHRLDLDASARRRGARLGAARLEHRVGDSHHAARHLREKRRNTLHKLNGPGYTYGGEGNRRNRLARADAMQKLQHWWRKSKILPHHCFGMFYKFTQSSWKEVFKNYLNIWCFSWNANKQVINSPKQKQKNNMFIIFVR